MVVFTCSHCGESLKKSKVEKHYLFSCRNFPALTCVDCLKDFSGDAYSAHTSCVTEEERYSAKGFVSKPPSCKGKNKQTSWIQFIRETLESNINIDRNVKDVLKHMGESDNAPKKREKFLNHCKNVFKSKYNVSVFESAWELLNEKRLEQENKNKNLDDRQIDDESARQEDRKRKRVDSLHVAGPDESKLISENSGCSGKKKKKQKREKCDTSTDELQNNEHVTHSNLNGESKKENNKSKFIQNGNDEDGEKILKNTENGKIVSGDRTSENRENEVIHLSKKEKKERKKREKYEKQLLEIQSMPVPKDDGEDQMEDNLEITEKSKKKKKNRQESLDNDKTEHTVVDRKTDHKKKKQILGNEIIEIQEPKREHEEEASEATTSTKFNWEEIIVKLLESKGELPLKRVEKKVVNEFINSGAHVESIDKAIAKFNKKILKMSRVKVKKDVVKLVS